jgi:hypothetical protein
MPHNTSIWNKKNGRVTEAVATGNGPDEVVSYIPVINNRDKSFTYADRIKKKLFSLDYVNDEVIVKEEFQMADAIQQLFCVAELNPTTLIATGFFTEGRFVVYNKETHQFFYEGIYPENDVIRNISPRHKAALYNSSQMGIHPGGKRFAIIYDGLFDLYEQTSNTEVKHLKANHYFFPEFTTNEIGPAVVFSKHNKAGFLRIACDAQSIYLLYSDYSVDELLKKYSSFWGDRITAFDWDGNPQTIYMLEKPIAAFSIEKDTIWAIDPNYEVLYKFRLT